MTYENFIVPNIYWEYVLGQHRVSFINEYYKKHKNYPTEDILRDVVLTTEEKEKYKRIFYAQYKATGIVPSDPNTPQKPDAPIIPPVGGDNEIETPDIPIIPPYSESNNLVCTYAVNTTGYTDLFYIKNNNSYIEDIIYDGQKITPLFSGNTVKYDFQKMGDIKVEYVLKEGTTCMGDVLFGETKLKEVIIPSCITTLNNGSHISDAIFYFGDYKTSFNKITSLNPNAPILDGKHNMVASTPNLGGGHYKGGTLYVPKNCSMNYASWMGAGIADNLLASKGWVIKELEY